LWGTLLIVKKKKRATHPPKQGKKKREIPYDQIESTIFVGGRAHIRGKGGEERGPDDIRRRKKGKGGKTINAEIAVGFGRRMKKGSPSIALCQERRGGRRERSA